MENNFSYIKAEYGRYASKAKVTRYVRIGGDNRISYIEKRTDVNGQNADWKLGHIAYLNFTNKQAKPSSKEEYDEAFQEALKSIQ